MTSGYGQVSNLNQPAQGNKKKLVLVAGSAIVLLAMVVAVAVGVSRRNNSSSSSSDAELTTTSKAIRAICRPTDYAEECQSSLAARAGNVTDPKKLVELSFTSAMDSLREAFNHSSVLQEAAKDPRTSEALENCKELLDYAIDDLKNSVARFGGVDMAKMSDVVDDLKVWLSATITYQQTCLDGFDNTTGDAADNMSKALNSSSALTSNALAIIDGISSVLASFQLSSLGRRLLSDDEGERGEFPSWVGNDKRKLLALSTKDIKPDVTVARDGSGKYKTITQALSAVPKKGNATFVIYIKEGVYKENVMVERSMTNVMMFGDGPTKTKITGSLNYVDGTSTFKTATLAVVGDGFIGKNLGVENTAGAAKHQAVALRVQSDKSVFYLCQMDGYQDTLYTHTKRQFYRECTISGTIDFLFGDAAVVFQNCLMLVRKPMANQQCIVTAQGRKDRHEATGIVLHNCTISADPTLSSASTTTRSYLGRPWKEYSRTIIMQSQIDGLINEDGWQPWVGDFGLKTCFYTEIGNRGPGAATAKRVTWKGYKKVDLTHAHKYTVQQFIQGKTWLPKTGVPFTPGLM
ncbi:putative pectinesterase/pectinesterase inhibitor 28 [Musa acuminata AAA Group]|uniref:putative pectinesterase/pectinesterase inhibitor 28 n=1 Tax=Musa acuminata AAA Group TaxID=214697 RepID=UPI0031DAE01A